MVFFLSLLAAHVSRKFLLFWLGREIQFRGCLQVYTLQPPLSCESNEFFVIVLLQVMLIRSLSRKYGAVFLVLALPVLR